jgi:hypothetical protein
MTVTDLIDFLNARLAEDEAVAQQAKATGGPMSPWWGAEQIKPLMVDADATHVEHHSPERVLREVAAKRRILNDIVPAMNGMDNQIHSEWGVGSMDPADYESVELLKLMAFPYSDHPDYNPEWSTP